MRTITRRLAGAALSLVTVGGLLVVTAPAAEAATACANQTFSYSLTTKTCVQYIQRLVNVVYGRDHDLLGGTRVLTTDGKYGTQTKSAVTNLQRHLVLKKGSSLVRGTVDGQTGVQTWTLLCAYGELDTPAWSKAGCSALVTPYSRAYVELKTH